MPPPTTPRTILLALTAALLLAGCTAGGPSYIASKFKDADQRVVQVADGGYQEYWEITVPPATPALTVRGAVRADQGFAFGLRDPAGRLTTSLSFPSSVEIPELTWIEVAKPSAGVWRLGVDCGRRCDLAFGFYLHDAVPAGMRQIPTYPDATARFTEDAGGASDRSNKLRIPADADRLELRASAVTDAAFTFRLIDPQGHQRAGLAFPGRALVDDAAYLVMEKPPAGTWTFHAHCRSGCAYGVGLYLE